MVITSSRPSVRQRNELTDSILAQIKNYYIGQFDQKTRLTEEITDSTIEWSFSSLPLNKGDYDGVLLSVYVPTAKNMRGVLEGDMNRDGRSDLVVSVHTEGGGGGGNMYWDDHFLFIGAEQNGYKLTDIKSDGEINGCGGGYLYPEKIEHGIIYGRADCYADEDGHCCPSLHYAVQIIYRNGELVRLYKQPITH